jgi:hypothetical protein
VYENIPGHPLEYASTILACISVLVTIPIYVVYMKGPQIRERSKFAQSLDATRKATSARRKSIPPSAGMQQGINQEKVENQV